MDLVSQNLPDPVPDQADIVKNGFDFLEYMDNFNMDFN